MIFPVALNSPETPEALVPNPKQWNWTCELVATVWGIDIVEVTPSPEPLLTETPVPPLMAAT